jgi:predicted transcriptional regulator
MIRNRDEQDEKIKTCVVQHPGITFTQLLVQTELNISTLRYRLLTMELADEIVCKKQRNQNQYFPSKTRNDE